MATNEELKNLRRYIYEYSESVEWDYSKTEELFKQLNLRHSEFMTYIKKHLKTIPNMSLEELEEKLERIKKLRTNNRLFLKNITTKYNPVLLKEGKEVKYLWKTDEEKDKVSKYIFEECVKYGVVKAQENLAIYFGTSVSRINSLYLYYCNKLRQNDIEEYNRMMSKITEKAHKDALEKIYEYSENSKSVKTLRKLLSVHTIEDIVDIIDKSNCTVIDLQRELPSFSYRFKNGDDIKNEINKKISMYQKYKSEERDKLKKEKEKLLEEELIIIATEVIKDFIQKDLSIDMYCKRNNITRHQFDKYVDLIKYKNEKLYEEYLELVNNHRVESYTILKSKLNELLDYLKNGIEVNGFIRDFDIVDYYLLIKVNIQTILNISRDLNKLDYDILKKFIFQNKNATRTINGFPKEILSSKVIINVERDKDGHIIPDSGEEVSKETKELVLKFLNEHNIPVNAKTYNIVFKRHINNNLELDSSNLKK